MDTCKFSWCSQVFICYVGVARWNTVFTSGSCICCEDGLVFGELGETCPLVFLKTNNKTKNPQITNKENEAKTETSANNTTKRKRKEERKKPHAPWDGGLGSSIHSRHISRFPTRALSPPARASAGDAARSCAAGPGAEGPGPGQGAPCPRWAPRRALPWARPAASPRREVGLYHGALAGKGEARTVRTPAVRTAARPAAQRARGKKQK